MLDNKLFTELHLPAQQKQIQIKFTFHRPLIIIAGGIGYTGGNLLNTEGAD
jgi:hypothetical protein